MNIAVGSAFRNATHYLPRYFSQVAALRDLVRGKHNVRVIAVEGDSHDDTANALSRIASTFGIDVEVRQHSHGRPWFGSTESPERMACLSGVGNAILDGVGPLDDVLVYVESDLLWEPFTIATLVECAAVKWRGYDIVAPMPFAGANFYDIWAFRGMDDQRFSPFKPYHASLIDREYFWTEVHSVGSCLVMRSEVARDRDCRMTDGALVEFCARAREAGYRIGVNPTLKVHHP
jgi:GT2 family glycosyltransferase